MRRSALNQVRTTDVVEIVYARSEPQDFRNADGRRNGPPGNGATTAKETGSGRPCGETSAACPGRTSRRATARRASCSGRKTGRSAACGSARANRPSFRTVAAHRGSAAPVSRGAA